MGVMTDSLITSNGWVKDDATIMKLNDIISKLENGIAYWMPPLLGWYRQDEQPHECLNH